MLNWRDPKNPLAGGAERVTLGYLSELARRGHQVYWFSFEYPNCLPEETIENVHIIRQGRAGSSIIKARHWYRHQPQFDLVIDQHHGIPWYAPWWCQTPCVAYIHEVLGPIWKSFYPWPLHWIGRLQERFTHWLYRRVPFWTASSATLRHLKHTGVQNITLLPYGVHTQALSALPDKSLTTPLQLVVASRLAPNKRIHHAIQAIDELRKRNIPANLTVIGDGEEKARLTSLVHQLKLQSNVHFTGFIDESTKEQIFKQSHFLLHTSIREGWGLNVIEANAMGTPAIVYPVDGLVESTLHRQTGLVTADETPQSLAQACQTALTQTDQYPLWRTQAWERSKTYHWSVVLPQACDWLEQMARQPRPFHPDTASHESTGKPTRPQP